MCAKIDRNDCNSIGFIYAQKRIDMLSVDSYMYYYSKT